MKTRYLVVALFVLSFISLFIGAKNISPLDILRFGEQETQVFLLSRVPRLISIIFAGVGMSIGGLIMQQINQNKFVSPETAGTVDSAKFGVLVSLLLFPAASTLSKMLVAFIFAIAGSLLFMLILRKIKFKNVIIVPLVGIMLGNVIESISTFFAYRYDLIQNVSAWMQGNFSLIIKGRFELLYLSIPLLFLALLYANRFTVAGMGEDFSKNLGLNYNKIVIIGVSIVALISALVVITVGKIPFLGLIVPNIVTLYFGDNLRRNILPTALFGAVFLLLCDIIGRVVIFPYELSISLTVGIIGSVMFLYLLFRRNAQ